LDARNALVHVKIAVDKSAEVMRLPRGKPINLVMKVLDCEESVVKEIDVATVPNENSTNGKLAEEGIDGSKEGAMLMAS
jgi:prephenate dehydratase